MRSRCSLDVNASLTLQSFGLTVISTLTRCRWIIGLWRISVSIEVLVRSAILPNFSIISAVSAVLIATSLPHPPMTMLMFADVSAGTLLTGGDLGDAEGEKALSTVGVPKAMSPSFIGP